MKNGEESSIKEIIQRAPPTSFLLNSGKLRGSASNDIVLMAALKGNGNTLLKEEALEEEQELEREKKVEEEILEEEIETEVEKEKEQELWLEEERNPEFVPEEERGRLDEEEVEAEREAVLLEESGYPMPVDHQYTGARRLIHAYVGDDGRLHYEPLSYASGYQNNHQSNENHLAYLLSRCLPARFHHLIEHCSRDLSSNHHHF